MESALTAVLDWIQAHPTWAGLFVMAVAALESLLVVGLFVPGTVVMFAIGAMVAAGTMELVPTLVWAALGAVLGDTTSYFIGRHYHQRLRVIWPFRRYPGLISRGVDFFHHHGGKSIALARFVGPVRPFVPAVAGMLDMPVKRFFLVNVLSALVWAPAYILPGFLFGASLGVAAEIAGRLALLLTLLVALLWFSWWLVRRLARSLQPYALAVQHRILARSRAHPHLYPLAASLLDPEHPEARGMSVLSVLLFIASLGLLTIPSHLVPGTLPGNLDLYVLHQLQNLRSPLGDRLLVVASALGSSWVLYGFTALLSLWLLWARHWRMVLHWVITVASVALLTYALKHYSAVPRPDLIDTSTLTDAFPSAHASVSVAVFGFLAVAIARELRSSWHWLPYSMAVFLVVATSFSRLYLGVHWLSDIIAGWSLGLAWVALMGIAYRQHPSAPIAARTFSPVALAVLIGCTSLYSSQRLERDLAFYHPRAVQARVIERSEWLQSAWRELPVYRDDFEGRNIHPLDIQWRAPLAAIEQALLARGFRHPHTAEGLHILDLLKSEARIDALPVLPHVHGGETQRLLMVKDTDDSHRRLVVRLWASALRVGNESTALWVGNASHLVLDTRLRLLRFLRTELDYNAALAAFAASLQGIPVIEVQREIAPPPADATDWSGVVLLIDGG